MDVLGKRGEDGTGIEQFVLHAEQNRIERRDRRLLEESLFHAQARESYEGIELVEHVPP